MESKLASSMSEPYISQNVEEPKKDRSLKGVVGIQNMGNTCYCNSTLQLIRACPEWSAYCLTKEQLNLLKTRGGNSTGGDFQIGSSTLNK